MHTVKLIQMTAMKYQQFNLIPITRLYTTKYSKRLNNLFDPQTDPNMYHYFKPEQNLEQWERNGTPIKI